MSTRGWADRSSLDLIHMRPGEILYAVSWMELVPPEHAPEVSSLIFRVYARYLGQPITPDMLEGLKSKIHVALLEYLSHLPGG